MAKIMLRLSTDENPNAGDRRQTGKLRNIYCLNLGSSITGQKTQEQGRNNRNIEQRTNKNRKQTQDLNRHRVTGHR